MQSIMLQHWLLRPQKSCLLVSYVAIAVISAWPVTAFAQFEDTEQPASQPKRENLYADLAMDQALAKSLDVVSNLEDSDRDPDQLQEERTEYIETLALIERILEIDPLNKTASYVKGRLLILSGRPRAALPMIEEYVNDPAGLNDWRAYKLLGDLYATSFPKHAVSKYRQAIELAENESEPVIGLARAQLKLNNAKAAVERSQDAIRLDKEGDPTFQATLAEALMMDRKFEDAARAAEAAVKMSEEKFARDPSNKAVLVKMQEHYDLRLQCISQLATLYPERADYVIQLARIWQDKADLERVVSYHQAIVMIERARTSPQLKVTTELLYEQARLNRLVSRHDKALSVLEEILQLDADFAPALELKNIIESEGKGLSRADTSASANTLP